MAEWLYFIHPPRENFAATMTEEEQEVWGVHFARFERLLLDGTIILVGPTLGEKNTGIAILEAPDEAGRPTDHGRGSGHRRRLRHWRAAAVPDLPAAGPRRGTRGA